MGVGKVSGVGDGSERVPKKIADASAFFLAFSFSLSLLLCPLALGSANSDILLQCVTSARWGCAARACWRSLVRTGGEGRRTKREAEAAGFPDELADVGLEKGIGV